METTPTHCAMFHCVERAKLHTNFTSHARSWTCPSPKTPWRLRTSHQQPWRLLATWKRGCSTLANSTSANSTSASWPKSNWPKSKLAEVEIDRSRNWPKSNRWCLLFFMFFWFFFVFFFFFFSFFFFFFLFLLCLRFSVFVTKHFNPKHLCPKP